MLAFLKFAMTKGQGMASSLQYAPLPSSLVTANMVYINAMRMAPK